MEITFYHHPSAKMTTSPKSIGIIVGRFQSWKLHEGYEYLFQTLKENFDQCGIFLGSSTNKIGRASCRERV